MTSRRAFVTGLGLLSPALGVVPSTVLASQAHMVPAGIVTINRAQERGYAFAYAAGL